MEEIDYTCKKHGKLEQCNISIRSARGTYRCRICERERSAKRRANGEMTGYTEAGRIASREWRRRNADKVNAKVNERRKADPEKYREYDRKFRNNDLSRYRLMDVLQKHKITEEEYYIILEKHNNLCAICKQPETRLSKNGKDVARLCLDHCHICEDKGQHIIRGLLCHACNVAIGRTFYSRMNKEMLDYLESHKHIE